MRLLRCRMLPSRQVMDVLYRRMNRPSPALIQHLSCQTRRQSEIVRLLALPKRETITGGNMKLSAVVALVTGGASGLGEATVRAIVAGGGKVAIMDRPNSAGETVAG